MAAIWGHSGVERCSSPRFAGKSFCSLSSSTPSSSRGSSYVFEDVHQMAKIIEDHRLKLEKGSLNQQYITFESVTSSEFGQIEMEEKQSLIGKSTRLDYDENLEELIVKLMPSGLYEAAHVNLAMDIKLKVHQMGLGRELIGIGSERFKGRLTSRSKEGDSTFKPRSRYGDEAWPTLVIETGLSESLPNLCSDADFWLTESGGDVNIVLLISVLIGGRNYRVERWELSGQIPSIPECRQEILVRLDSSLVAGGPLRLDFEKVFLRPPAGQETDIVLNDQDLLEWAEMVWTAGARSGLRSR